MKYVLLVMLGWLIGSMLADISPFNSYREVQQKGDVHITYRAPETLTLSHQDDVPNSTRCYYFKEVPDSLDCIYLDPELRKASVKPLQ